MSKKLGQHFLKNKSKIKKIVEVLELKKGDVVIEIGAGHGELTLEIKNQNEKIKNKLRIIAIEKDKKLADSLQLLADRNFKSQIEIVNGDALKILPNLISLYNLKANSYKLVGNIPYYITGRLLRILSESESKPTIIVLTIQKEVAQRICAKTPQMNLLAAVTQFWAESKIIDYISKKDFKPAPKVDSAIIKLTANNLQPTTKDAEKYYKFVKVLFKQPRKTIANNLLPTILTSTSRDSNPDVSVGKPIERRLRSVGAYNRQPLIEKLKSAGVDPQGRPQNLSLEQIKHLSTLF